MSKLVYIAPALLAAGIAYAGVTATAETTSPANTLSSPSAFAAIRDRNTRSLALFAEVAKVITHPRCLNCHPAGDRPTQTDAMRPHMPWVTRGDGGIGAAGMRCPTCHHAENFDPARVPGNPKWSLAPNEMAWQGLTPGEICRQIKDEDKNGGRDMRALVEHMSSDELVGWAWHPGAGRTPAPGTQAQFGQLVKAWADSGAACPR